MSELSQPEFDVRMLNNCRVPMRDGVELAADVYLPDAAGRWPVILQRTPYGSNSEIAVQADSLPFGGLETALFFAKRGYAVVIQDVRGRFDSDGEWYAWTGEIEDGHDTLNWCGTQPWSDGNVGMFGISYGGDVQWWAAQAESPYLKTIIPYSAHADHYLDGMNYRGGAFKFAGNIQWAIATSARTMQPVFDLQSQEAERRDGEDYDWRAIFDHLPILTADEAFCGHEIDFYRDWVRHSAYDDYWKSISSRRTHDRIDIPVLQIGGWFDVHIVSTFAHLEGIQEEGTPLAKRHHKMVIGPWVHGAPRQQLGVLDFGEDSMFDILELELRWLDRWLKQSPNGVEDEPALKLFSLGRNEWRTGTSWPLPETEWTRLYLRSEGGLSVDEPGEGEAPDAYAYNPAHPVPTLWEDPWGDGPVDYSSVEQREDVLLYTTEPLSEDLELTGPVQAHIFASSSAPDTDWTVRLLDVHPDGMSVSLCDGILRARFHSPAAVRTGVTSPGQFEDPQLLEPGKIYPFTIEVGVLSAIFRRGHRLRIHISSSNFPRFDRNLNNGGELGVDPHIVIAEQRIFHDGDHASFVELPVVPGDRG